VGKQVERETLLQMTSRIAVPSCPPSCTSSSQDEATREVKVLVGNNYARFVVNSQPGTAPVAALPRTVLPSASRSTGDLTDSYAAHSRSFRQHRLPPALRRNTTLQYTFLWPPVNRGLSGSIRGKLAGSLGILIPS
jgi:hypothetical protein